MALAELIGKLRSKKQAATRSTFGEYLALVRRLADGTEIDSDEAGRLMDAAGKSEDNLEHDVATMLTRLAAADKMARHALARKSFEVASRTLIAAQEKLDEAYRRFQPAVEAAINERAARELEIFQTASGEGVLLNTVLDKELLQQESRLIDERMELHSKLRPLTDDRKPFVEWVRGEHYRRIDLQKQLADAPNESGKRHARGLVEKSDRHTADLKDRLKQLDAAIGPMQNRFDAINTELDQIHLQKLEP